jgi:hypothetical protein
MNETINYLERILDRCRDDKMWEAYNVVWEALCSLEDELPTNDIPSDAFEDWRDEGWAYPEDEMEDIYPIRESGPDYYQNADGEWCCG